MKLLYMWIEQFRNIHNQGVTIDNEYIIDIREPTDSTFQYFTQDGTRIHYADDLPVRDRYGRKVFERSISITPNVDYVKSSLAEPIESVAVLVGKNASGKSSILECLSQRNDQSNYRNPDGCYYFLVFYDEADNTLLIRSKDIRISNYDAYLKDPRRASGYYEYRIPIQNNCSQCSGNRKDITHHFNFSLRKSISNCDAYMSVGLPTVCSNLDSFSVRNSFEGVFKFLCDFSALGVQDNRLVFYLEDDDTERNGVPYYTTQNLTHKDYKYFFIHKFAQIIFGNLRRYLFRPERQYSAADTVLFPSPEQDRQLSDEDWACAEILSFANLTYPHHPSRGAAITYTTKSSDDCALKKINAALEFFKNCTFIHQSPAKRIFDDFLIDIAELFELLYKLDEVYYQSLFKLELGFSEEHLKLVQCFSNLIYAKHFDEGWTTGVAVDFEWFSAGEAHLALLFSGIYQQFSKCYDGFEKRHIILSIDEPEMHMHPETGRNLLQKLKDTLLSFKEEGLLATCQIILATHSPFIIQQLNDYNNVISLVLKEHAALLINDFKNLSILRLPNSTSYSFGLVMYRIFGVPTIELHNELYGVLQEQNKCYSADDIDRWFISKGLKQSRSWTPIYKGKVKPTQSVTLQTFVRNFIHHPENKLNLHLFLKSDLKNSIDEMLKLI